MYNIKNLPESVPENFVFNTNKLSFEVVEKTKVVKKNISKESKKYKKKNKWFYKKNGEEVEPIKVKMFNKDEINDYVYDFFLNNDESNDNIYYEYINPKLLKFILKNKKKIEEILEYENEELNYIFNIMTIIDKININGFYETSYYQSECGRQFIKKDISFQKFKREIRHLLSYGLYYDLDIKNCHPTLFAYLCEKFEIKDCPNIFKYRDHRDECIKELLELNPHMERDDIKEYILCIMNGGYTYLDKFKKKSNFLINYKKDIENVSNQIKGLFPERFNHFLNYLTIKNEKKPPSIRFSSGLLKIKAQRRLVSYYLMHLENDILHDMINYFEKEGLIKHKLVIKIFDGFQISSSVDINCIKKHIRLVEKVIKKNNNINIKVSVKDFKKCNKLLKIIPKDLLKKSIPLDNLKELIEKNQFNIERFKFINKNKIDGIEYDLHTSKRFLDPYCEHVYNNDTVFIKSPMASKKTVHLYRFLKKYLNKLTKNKFKQGKLDSFLKKKVVKEEDEQIEDEYEYNGKKVCFISFRKSLEKKYIEDLPDFEYYEHIKTPFIDADEHPRLVIQINSIHRILGKYDVVILDEISYIFDTLISFCKNKRKIYDVLKQMLESCDKLICMDAYITKNEIDYIKHLRPNKRNFTILNTINEFRGNVHFYKKDTFINRLVEDLNNGLNVVFASNSKTYLQKQIIPQLKKLGIKYLLETNEANLTDSARWVDYQIVLYTPTIVAGVSFETAHFDKRYGYFSNMSSPANMCCQQLFRVRSTTDPNIHLLVNQLGKNYKPTKREAIDEYLTKYINLETNVLTQNEKYCISSGFVNIDVIKKQFKKDEYYELLVNYISKINQSKNNLKTQLLKYLAIQGYYRKNNKKLNVMTDDIKEFNVVHKELVKGYCDAKALEEVELYRTAEIPSDIEMKFLDKKDRKTKMDKVGINLYSLKQQGIDIGDRPDSEIKKLIRNINNVRFDDLLKKSDGKKPCDFVLDRIMYHSKKCNRDSLEGFYFQDDDEDTQLNAVCAQNDDEDEYHKFDIHKQYKRDYWLKCYHSLKIISAVGFEDLNDFKTVLCKFSKKDLQRIHKYILDNWDDLKILFSISDKMKNYKEFIGNNFILTINSKIKIINRRIKKKSVGKKKIATYLLQKIVEI